MTTAMVSRNAVVSHCTSVAGALKASISGGRATLMAVSLSITTKVETSSVLMTIVLRRAKLASLGAGSALAAA